MTIENPRTPTNPEDMVRLAYDLTAEFEAQGLRLEPDFDFGHLNKDYFGFRVSDEMKRVELGFLQILFDPSGWTALAGQNDLGKRVLSTLSTSLGRDPEQMKLEELTITLAMYRTYFPYKVNPTVAA